MIVTLSNAHAALFPAYKHINMTLKRCKYPGVVYNSYILEEIPICKNEFIGEKQLHYKKLAT